MWCLSRCQEKVSSDVMIRKSRQCEEDYARRPNTPFRSWVCIAASPGSIYSCRSRTDCDKSNTFPRNRKNSGPGSSGLIAANCYHDYRLWNYPIHGSTKIALHKEWEEKFQSTEEATYVRFGDKDKGRTWDTEIEIGRGDGLVMLSRSHRNRHNRKGTE